MIPARRDLLLRTLLVGGLAGSVIATPRSARAQSAEPTRRRSPAQLEAQAPPMPAPGEPLVLPDVDLLDGKRFAARDAQGRVLVIYWWASTCPFCALQSPSMQALWESSRERGLQMLALSIDRTPQAAADYLKKKGFTFPAAWASDELLDVLPKPKGLPITIVRGRDGRVLQSERGQLFPEDVEELARWLG